MEKYVFSKDCEQTFADYFANLFKYSVKAGVDSEQFISAVLTLPVWRRMLTTENVHYYSHGYYYSINNIVTEGNVEVGPTYPEYVMWMYGYLLKWLVYRYPDDLDYISKCFPIRHFNQAFTYYHTQGWEVLVQEAHERVVKYLEEAKR